MAALTNLLAIDTSNRGIRNYMLLIPSHWHRTCNLALG